VSKDDLEEMPIEEILQYISTTFGTNHYVALNGVKPVVDGLSSALPQSRIHLGPEEGQVERIRPPPYSPCSSSTSISTSDSPNYQIRVETCSGQTYDFDHLIFALPAHQTRPLLSGFVKELDAFGSGSAMEMERKRLDDLLCFKFSRSLVINHSDTSVLPPNQEDWRELNIAIGPRSGGGGGGEFKLDRNYVMATHIISNPDGGVILQTTNPTVDIDPEKMLSVSWFERARLTTRCKKVLSRFKGDEGCHQGLSSIWFAGSWVGEGIPLLEGCVTSAEEVVGRILLSEGGKKLISHWNK